MTSLIRASVSGDAVERIWDDMERCGAVVNCGELPAVELSTVKNLLPGSRAYIHTSRVYVIVLEGIPD
jgi:hypothetical protein